MRFEALLCLLVAVAGEATAPPQAPSISRIEISPRAIDTRSRDEARIRFFLSSPAAVAVRILDRDESEVWARESSFGRGYGEFRWDGRTEDHKKVLNGVYIVSLGLGLNLVAPAQTASLTRAVSVYDLTLDHATGRLAYRLPEPAEVQVRFGLGDGGPLLRTIDAFQGAGQQVIHWDGWDQSHVVNLIKNQDVLASVRATSLPDNTIIVCNAEITSPQPSAFRIQFQPQSNVGAKTRQHRLTAEITATANVDSLLRGERYEWLFFVDHRFVFEEEKSGTNPYVLELDTSPLSEGEHLLTVNLAGQVGNYVCSASSRFAVEKQEGKP